MTRIHTLYKDKMDSNTREWVSPCLEALEEGQVIFLPDTVPVVAVDERAFLEPDCLDGKHKNLSFDPERQRLGGLNPSFKATPREHYLFKFMSNYAKYAKELVQSVLPSYKDALIMGRSSYRPAEISGRSSSKRKDDTRLHVDAFPASPVNGQRILRLFSNINFEGKPRHWHLGEAFPEVLARFYPHLPPYRPSLAQLMYRLKLTKKLRSAYDHTMLHLHDQMKLDDDYQNSVKKTAFPFPAMSTWMVFSDQVSHAALGGQYLLEQTFYLPVEAMSKPELSPLRAIEARKKTSCTVK